MKTKELEKYYELVYLADSDPELKDALRWADKKALERGISINEMIKRILATKLKRESATQFHR